ncbi:unnamed protein product [Arctogadus glacialis]
MVTRPPSHPKQGETTAGQGTSAGTLHHYSRPPPPPPPPLQSQIGVSTPTVRIECLKSIGWYCYETLVLQSGVIRQKRGVVRPPVWDPSELMNRVKSCVLVL